MSTTAMYSVSVRASNAPMNDVRQNLADYLAPLRARGLSLRELSRRLGRNESYLAQYLAGKKSPRKLAHDDKLALHAAIGIPLELLGLSPSTLGPTPVVGPPGGADDVEPCDPSDVGSDVALPRAGRPFRVTRDVVGRHPLGLQVGDVVIVASHAEGLQGLRSEQLVLVEMPPREGMPRRLLLRQFIRPALVITNRDGANEAVSLDGGPAGDRPRVVGVVQSMLRPA